MPALPDKKKHSLVYYYIAEITCQKMHVPSGKRSEYVGDEKKLNPLDKFFEKVYNKTCLLFFKEHEKL